MKDYYYLHPKASYSWFPREESFHELKLCERNTTPWKALFGNRAATFLIFYGSQVKGDERCRLRRLMLHLFFENSGGSHFPFGSRKIEGTRRKGWWRNRAGKETKITFIFSGDWHPFSFYVILLKQFKNGSEDHKMGVKMSWGFHWAKWNFGSIAKQTRGYLKGK